MKSHTLATFAFNFSLSVVSTVKIFKVVAHQHLLQKGTFVGKGILCFGCQSVLLFQYRYHMY